MENAQAVLMDIIFQTALVWLMLVQTIVSFVMLLEPA
jgi:hypothetical protein